MARQSRNPAIDALCREWAKVRRQLLGIDEPKLAKDYLGALRSTLAQRRDLHAGSKSNKLEQHWPEVYTGRARQVNNAFVAMRPYYRVLMDVHYVARAPLEDKIEFLCVAKDTYWREMSDVRAFVDGWLAREDQIAVSTSEIWGKTGT